jgi:Ca2+-transporting ATPase
VTKDQKEQVLKQIEDLTQEGKRVIGFARKEVPSQERKLSRDDVKTGLTWVGFVSFSDPVRPGVTEALRKAQKAGVKIIVITGDYPNTARAVLAEIGMPVALDEMLSGEELKKLNIDLLAERVGTVKLFARTTPEQKLKIVEALKKKSEVVAMMGDGVNDAPALNKADIGIVVGEASDVARESADLVLLDSNFATIVAAIEEGRGIFDNIRKIILYLLSDAFGEILTVVGAIVLGFPLPVTAVQILWINLVSDGFPDLALTLDPVRSQIMREGPRSPKEGLVAPWMRALIILVSFASGVAALGFFVLVFKSTNDVVLARSAAFLTLGINSLVYVFSVKSLTAPFWENNAFENKWLNLAVVGGFALQASVFISPSIRNFFGVSSLPLGYWALAIGLSIAMFIIVELSKFIFRIQQK